MSGLAGYVIREADWLGHGPGPAALIERIIRASEFEALAEVRDRLLGVLQAPQQLLGVHVEVVAGPAPKCRLSLQLSDAGRGLAAALGDGAGDVDRLVVEKALSHPDLSDEVMRSGDDAESGAGETSPPAEPTEDLAHWGMP